MTRQVQEICEHIHAEKHRLPGESFDDCTARLAGATSDSVEHFTTLKEIFRGPRFMAGGRVQAAMGAPKKVAAHNCFLSGVVEDSMDSIMDRAAEAAQTMRMGGGIGYDFSRLRPRGDRIVSLDSYSSGPVSFMRIYDAICQTISSSGHRRGAQMGVLRVDHPDIEEFIHAKQNSHSLTAFNISVGITDEFMEAVLEKRTFELKFDGRVYTEVDAASLWDEIMRSTWNYAEPGVLFLDRINEYNNLWYCEKIEATNPCAEQPLPPHGACLLGSFNLPAYINGWEFNYEQFKKDIPEIVRAMDNVVDRALYPLEDQWQEAISKRRMGLGVMGLANALETLGYPYGSQPFLQEMEQILRVLRDEAYRASIQLAAEKGPFPLFRADKYPEGRFIRQLPEDIQEGIAKYGIRNSHLLSIAPTGTISLAVGNVSSGIEPTYLESYERQIQTPQGRTTAEVVDYGVLNWGTNPKTADQCSVQDHLNVLVVASKYVDSAVSKTCNVGADVTWAEFKDIYMQAWLQGTKGCTTFRASGKRKGILTEITDQESGETEIACTIDPTSGLKTCDS